VPTGSDGLRRENQRMLSSFERDRYAERGTNGEKLRERRGPDISII